MCLRVGNIETRRAILDVNDLISAFILLMEKGTVGDVYNISSEIIYQIKDIIKMIEDIMGAKYELFVDPELLRPTDERVICGDVGKLKRDTGWEQRIPLKVTIQRMLDYWNCHLGDVNDNN